MIDINDLTDVIIFKNDVFDQNDWLIAREVDYITRHTKVAVVGFVSMT